MPFTQTKLFKVFVAPLLFLFCFFVILQSSPRLSGFILLLALVVTYIRFLWTAKTRWMRLIFVAFLIAELLAGSKVMLAIDFDNQAMLMDHEVSNIRAYGCLSPYMNAIPPPKFPQLRPEPTLAIRHPSPQLAGAGYCGW